MRKIFTLIIILAVGCSGKDQPEAEIEITLSKTELRVSAAGGDEELAVRTNAKLQTSSDQNWCTIAEVPSASTTTLKYVVAVAANTNTDERTASITFNSGSITKSVSVLQSFADALAVEKTQIEADASSSNISIKVSATGSYDIDIKNPWINRATVTRSLKATDEVFTLQPNYGGERTGSIVFSMGAKQETVVIKQSTLVSAPPDKSGMESDASQLVVKMGLGWNLGNTMEAPSGETSWGNAVTSEKLIKAVKAAGFNAVRIPCAWDSYIDDRDNNVIRLSWLQRVGEVVDYCVANDMYAIVNIHWDGGWLDNNPTYAKQAEVTAKMRAVWTQIAAYFRDYDEHLLFAGTNEVHETDAYSEPKVENIEVQLSYNQTFVDAVRATGGKNAWRNLILQSYSTNIDLAVKYLKGHLPENKSRLMVEVHYYDPYNFTINDGDGAVYFWGDPYKKYGNTGNWAQEDYLDETFKKMKTNFADEGFPVILGEYCAMRRLSLRGEALTNHLASRAYFLKMVTAAAVKYGFAPFYWDSGYTGDTGSGIFDRATGDVIDIQGLQGIVENNK